tara:strand:- start:805 stop:2184 length:1380 start_codon:yes stop_codon:yes gene_type:complete
MARVSSDGPRYRADQANDGSWTIYNVPIFSVHTDDRGGEPLEFDTKWLKRALKKGLLRHAEGYYPPLHIRHHGDSGVEAAGKIRFTHLSSHPHGGDQIPTIFADLIGVRPEVYQKIRRGELSYRSVEILDIDSPEIDSLALLDDEVPFFRYPLLRIGQERARKKTPALAYKARGKGGSILFNYGGPDVDDQEKQDAAPAWAAEMLKVLMDLKSGMKGAFKESDKDDDDKDFAEEEDILDLKKDDGEDDPELKSIPTTLDPKDSDYPSTPPKPDEGTPTVLMPPKKADDDDDEEDDDVKKKKRQSPYEVGVSRAAMSAVKDTIKTLRQEIESLKAEQRIEKQAAKLSASGVDSTRVKRFKENFRKHGERAALVYAQAIQEMNPTLPPRQFTGEISYGEKADPSVVSAYAQQGPEALERARSLHRSFEKTKPEMALERYLQINMDPDAFFASARSSINKGA